MESLRVLASRFLALFRHVRLERDLNEDIQAHLEMLVAENIQRGMSAEEARYAARRSFGGVEPMKEIYRSQRSFRSLETLVQDVRFGLRMLRKSPSFALVPVLTISLGIGANAAIFSMVDSFLLRPTPVSGPQQLLRWPQKKSAELIPPAFLIRIFKIFATSPPLSFPMSLLPWISI
jgi:hypothetical protein